MSYPPLSISPNQSRAALLANLRTSPSPNNMYGNNGSQGGYPVQQDGSRRASATSTSGGSSAGPRLPPHVPQRQQRYPSSEHTLGPSFDDDDEDEEMVAKMAALNAGVYPFGAGARSGRASASGVAGGPQQSQQQQQQQSYGGGPGRGHDGPYQQQQQLDRQLQQERQQQELLRVALQLAQQQGGHHQQNGRGMSELQILQALQAQQQQREVEAQMEQLLKIQQAQNLQQQLIAQARQAALLAEQPYGNPPSRGYSNSPTNGGGRYDPAAAYAQQSHAQAQAQALYQAQLRAHAQQQQQQANPQQLASAYEQRHAAQQQIQANLRARSAGGGGAPPLPPPGGNGSRFGFESSDVNELAAQLGRTTMAGGGAGGAYPADPRASGPQSGHLSPAGSDRFGGSGVPRMASPLSAMHQPGGFLGGRSDSPNAGQQQQQQQRDVRLGRPDELPPPHQVSAAASIWGGGQTSNNGGPTSPWQQNAQPTAPLAQQQQQQQPQLASGRPHSSNGASRFAFAQQQQQQQQAPFDGRSEKAAPFDTHADLRSPASSDKGGYAASNASARNAAQADPLRPIYEGLGMGRPAANSASAAPVDRTQSMSAAAQLLSAGGRSRDASPGPPLQRITSDPYGRQPAPQQQPQQTAAPASNGTVTVLRQPIGPPSVPDELGSRNFASRIRKQAGSNLSLLGRREGSVPPV